MPFLAEITMPSGNIYKFKDEGARELIQQLFNYHEYLGVTTTPLSEGATTNPIIISGESVTAVSGDVATYENQEFVYSSVGTWQNFAKLFGLGALAFKDSASGSFTPSGTVSQPSFTGSEMTSSGKYTPAGSVSAPIVTMVKTTVKALKSSGALPICVMPTFTVSGERLIITDGSYTQGSLPTSEDVSVASDVDSVSAPTFTGTEGDLSVKGTPSGTVSQPTFSGTTDTVTVS